MVASLLLDNLRFHKDVDPIILAKKNFVHLLFLPPNTSHFLQPLDDLVFARYKTHLAKLARQLLLALKGTTTKQSPALIITAVTSAAEKVAFSPDAIKLSFKNCGMWPINIQKIQDMAALNIGKPKDSPSPQKSPRKASRIHYRQKVADAVMELHAKKESTRKKSEEANLRVTPTVEYGMLFDTDSIIAKSEEVRTAKELDARLKAEIAREKAREKERRASINEDRRIEKEIKAEEKEQKLREKANIDEAKRLRGVGTKRKRADPPELELNCIVKDCRMTWNTADTSKWMFCEHCDACCVCKGHWQDPQGHQLLIDHEGRCPHRPRKKQKVDS